MLRFGLWKNDGPLLLESRHLVPDDKKFKETDLECRRSQSEAGREKNVQTVGCLADEGRLKES